jgi:predicted phage-related endonuclease
VPQLTSQSPEWPSLKGLVLSNLEREERRAFVGGSDANLILSGDRDKVMRLWREKRGEAESEDLSSSLAVMLGCWTEAFNRQWFERISGDRVLACGSSLTCEKYPWRRCTLDGLVEPSGAVWEAKHTSAFSKPEEVLDRYMPQLQHNMAVAKCDRAVLSVIFGNHKFEIFEIASDWLYQLELLEAEEQFWDCVLSGKEPATLEPPPPPKPIGTREVCLEGNNAWASAAFDWLKHREAAKAHASAVSVIKSLVDDDVARAFGHRIEAKRSKSGAITIREFPQ